MCSSFFALFFYLSFSLSLFLSDIRTHSYGLLFVANFFSFARTKKEIRTANNDGRARTHNYKIQYEKLNEKQPRKCKR